MNERQTQPLPSGYVINDLYEIVCVLEVADTTVTYLANHRARGVQVQLKVLKSNFDSSSIQFREFMKRIQEDRRRSSVRDIGALKEGLAPYAVYDSKRVDET